MRISFREALIDLAGRDPRIVLLTGDLGFTVLEPFAQAFPQRFFNVGVAEQNMVGIASGLAEAGFLPYLYSIATFAALRPYEFIRNGPVHQNLPVRIVAVGGGFEYGHAGPTHHALEDLAIMRAQPGLVVVSPADHQQARRAVRSTWDLPGPIYYRLGKDDRTVVPGLDGRFELGQLDVLSEGRDLLLLSTGSISVDAARAVAALADEGISATHALVSSFGRRPDRLVDLLKRFPVAVTVEAHYVTGGLGSYVAEVVAEEAVGCRLVRCGVRTPPDGRSGDQEYFHRRHGLSCSAIVNAARAAMERSYP
jgi:transketolase